MALPSDREPAPSEDLYVWQLPLGADDEFLRQLFEQAGTVTLAKHKSPEKRYGFVRMASQEEAAAAILAIDGLEAEGTFIRVKYSNSGGVRTTAYSRENGTPRNGAPVAPILLLPNAAGGRAPSAPLLFALQTAVGGIGNGVSNSGRGYGIFRLLPNPNADLSKLPFPDALPTTSTLRSAVAQRFSPVTFGGLRPSNQFGGGESPPADNLYVWNLPAGSDDSTLQDIFSQFGTIVSLRCMHEKRYGFVRFATLEEASLAKDAVNGLECLGTKISVKYANPRGGGGGHAAVPNSPY